MIKKLFSLAAAVLVCAGVWAASYIPGATKIVTENETLEYGTFSAATSTTEGNWIVNPRGSSTSGKKYTNVNGDSNGNPKGITDNIATISSNVNMQTIQVPSTAKYNQNGRYVIHMRIKGIEGLIAHGVTGSTGRGVAIYGQEYTTSLDENTEYGTALVSMTRSGSSGSFILQHTGLDADKEYLITIAATGGDVQLYAIELVAPSAIAPAITAPTTDQEAEYTVGDAITALAVTATGAPAPTYKWYSNATKSTEGADEIEGATEASYTPSNAAVSDLYYYCVATNASGSATSPYFHVSVAAAPTFDVTYATDKGEAPAAQPSVTSVELPQIAAVEGFIHTAWTANVATKVAGETVAAGTEIAIGTTVFVSAATTFTAVWTPTVTITLNPVGGASEDVAGWTLTAGKYSKTVASGAEVALPVFTKADRTFKTWRHASTDADVASPVAVNANIELNAVWTKTLETVIYSWEGAEGGAIEVGGTAATYNKDGNNIEDDASDLNIAAVGASETYYAMRISGSISKGAWAGNYIMITTDEAVKTSDVVKVTACSTKGDTSKKTSPLMKAGEETTSTSIFEDDGTYNDIKADGTLKPNTRNFIVPANINTNTLTIVRKNTSTNCWITKLVITRNVPVEEGDLVTVTFDAAGGSNVDAIDLVKGEKVAEPTAPTKDGYDFDGWYLAGNLYDFDAAVNSNIELVAKWVVAATKYTVTYKHGEAVLGTEEVEEGNAPAQYATAQTKVSLATFVGWYYDEDLEESVTDMSAEVISAEKTYYTKFTYKYATSINIEQAVLDNSKKFNLLNALGAKNYATNWTNDLDSLTEEKANTDRNYPYLGEKVKAAGKMIDFRLAQGSIVKVKFGNVPDDVKVVINGVENTITKATLANPYEYNATEDTYMSIRSTTGNTLVFKQIMIDEDIQTVVLPALYTVTYNAGDGTCAVAKAETQFAGDKVVLPAATPAENYEFDGWYDAATDGTKIGEAGAEYAPTANITLYAYYTPAGGGSAINNTDAAVKTVKVIRNGQLIIIRDGKEFNVLGTAVK